MRIFVAGASGAIGEPLVAELVRRGHEVTGMTHSEAGARHLADMGAAVAQVSAFDAGAIEQALKDARAEVVIDELTSLPKRPTEMAAAAPGDRKLRIEGGGNPVWSKKMDRCKTCSWYDVGNSTKRLCVGTTGQQSVLRWLP